MKTTLLIQQPDGQIQKVSVKSRYLVWMYEELFRLPLMPDTYTPEEVEKLRFAISLVDGIQAKLMRWSFEKPWVPLTVQTSALTGGGYSYFQWLGADLFLQHADATKPLEPDFSECGYCCLRLPEEMNPAPGVAIRLFAPIEFESHLMAVGVLWAAMAAREVAHG